MYLLNSLLIINAINLKLLIEDIKKVNCKTKGYTKELKEKKKK